MPYLMGLVLALAAGGYATAMRLDRDRAFYPTVMMVIASYYVLFAVMGGSSRALVVESLIAGVFVLAASLGFRSSLWLVVAALAAHGGMDFVHARFVVNPGVPAWWPAWCGAYDVAAAGYLAWRLARAGATSATSATRLTTIPTETVS